MGFGLQSRGASGVWRIGTKLGNRTELRNNYLHTVTPRSAVLEQCWGAELLGEKDVGAKDTGGNAVPNTPYRRHLLQIPPRRL